MAEEGPGRRLRSRYLEAIATLVSLLFNLTEIFAIFSLNNLRYSILPFTAPPKHPEFDVV